MLRLGQGSLMVKFAVQNAYCIVPVHTKDHQLLGIKWRSAFYRDRVLPFGPRSPPCIFICIADWVECIVRQNYDVTFLMHYFDDFHPPGRQGSSVCQHNLNRSIYCFSNLGIPLHRDKQDWPSMCLTILGIDLDSLHLQARLPLDKFDRITALLEEWPPSACLQGCTSRSLFLVPNDQPAMCFLLRWPPDSSQSGVLSWPSLECSFLQYPHWAPLPDSEVSLDTSWALGYGVVFQGHCFLRAELRTQVSQSIE